MTPSSNPRVRLNRAATIGVAVVLLVYFGWSLLREGQSTAPRVQPANAAIVSAFQTRQSGLQVEGEGSVVQILPDDLDGSRHQRFVLQLNPELTVLVAHNIDLAPRVDSLKRGDVVAFFGEYEWNPSGGVIHWTHHDPAHRHADGWLRHSGEKYE